MTGTPRDLREPPPAVARRSLRLTLRQNRESRGFTQGQVAAALDWSLSKVNRIELGDVIVSHTDLQALLRLFGVDDPALIDRLDRHRQAARRRDWWDDPRYRLNVTPSMIELLQFASVASQVVAYHPMLVPGFAQIPAYAAAVLEAGGAHLRPEEQEIRLDFRMRLKELLLGSGQPPECVLILDESIVLRQLGGPKVMVDQLDELLMSCREERLIIRILPLAPSPVVVFEPSFVLAELGGDAVLYRESTLTDELIDNPDTVGRYRDIVNKMLDASLHPGASLRLIEAKVAVLRSELDRT
jgi:transcriptional regulator with XRE-family HTH domain